MDKKTPKPAAPKKQEGGAYAKTYLPEQGPALGGGNRLLHSTSSTKSFQQPMPIEQLLAIKKDMEDNA